MELWPVKPPPAQSSSANPSSSWRQVIDNPWLMLGMLFGVTLFLGLPFLWISRGFSLFGKIVVTILVLLWSALVFWIFWLIMAWCIPRIMTIWQ
jgi:hypothetical protein